MEVLLDWIILNIMDLLCIILYEMFFFFNYCLLQVMKQIPDVNLNDLQKFDDRMIRDFQKGTKVDKAKKEMFKKVTSPVSIFFMTIILSIIYGVSYL